LLKHLTYVELRWLEWGFEGRRITDPWGDNRGDRWYVAEDETLDHLVANARHLGHLDIVAELAHSQIGE
jgi:Protein of unknown function (DUF664)